MGDSLVLDNRVEDEFPVATLLGGRLAVLDGGTFEQGLGPLADRRWREGELFGLALKR